MPPPTPNSDPIADVFDGAHDGTVMAPCEVEEVRRPQRPHVLDQVRGPGAPKQIVLSADRMTVGRSPDCEIQADSPGISWLHLLITRRGPEYACEDCDSSNGVFLNGVRIQSAVLREGDQIQISNVVFLYHEGA